MLTSIFLSFLGGVGIFLIVLSLTARRMPGGLERIARLMGEPGEKARSPADPSDSPIHTFRKHGLAAAIAQADVQVTPAGFIRVGLLIALLSSLGVYLLTDAIGVSILMGAVGLILYIQWLYQRRDAKRLEYEETLADMCDRLGVGAQLYGSLKGAMNHAAEMAPEVAKDDFSFVAGQITSGASIHGAFEDVQRSRRSTSLDLLVDTITVWSNRGATIPLQQILSPLSTTIRETASERKRMHSELSGVRSQMRLVAVAPVILVALMRFSSPALASIYASPSGESIQTVAYMLALVGFLLGTRALAKVSRVLEIEDA